MAKPRTSYAPVTKPRTGYTINPATADGVRLDSATVTLASLTVHLHGYTTTDPPANSTKPPTAYGQS